MNDLLHEFPTRRIKPADGMAVTAQVWEEAHDYHRHWQRAHELYAHGPCIVTGLDVIASDPADSSLYILPGIAVDPRGQTIVVAEPVAYDIGQAQGQIYLLLTYEESLPTAAVRTGSEQGRTNRVADAAHPEDGPLYIYAQFSIEATPTLPDGPYVELARLRRQSRESALLDARRPVHPGPNEIDLRFRQEAGPTCQEIISVAVSYTGGPTDDRHGRGADALARALRYAGRRAWVDDRILLGPGLESYTLLYLVGQDSFQLDRDEMNALYAFLQGGGTLFVEACRRNQAGDPPAVLSFLDLLASMGIQLQEVPPEHDLLSTPHLFATPTPGFETEEPPRLLAGEGVILNYSDYGCLWQGERRDRPATREEIRAAIEWGENLVAYALKRRKNT
jgi:hypothetical protein